VNLEVCGFCLDIYPATQKKENTMSTINQTALSAISFDDILGLPAPVAAPVPAREEFTVSREDVLPVGQILLGTKTQQHTHLRFAPGVKLNAIALEILTQLAEWRAKKGVDKLEVYPIAGGAPAGFAAGVVWEIQSKTAGPIRHYGLIKANGEMEVRFQTAVSAQIFGVNLAWNREMYNMYVNGNTVQVRIKTEAEAQKYAFASAQRRAQGGIPASTSRRTAARNTNQGLEQITLDFGTPV
jgi:hypothetical protein